MLHLLERAHPEEYAAPPKRLEQSVSGPDGGPQRMALTVSIVDAIEGARENDETRADKAGVGAVATLPREDDDE